MPTVGDRTAAISVAFEDGVVREGTVIDMPAAPHRGGRRLNDTWSLVFDAGWDALMDAHLTVSDARVFYCLSRRAPLTGGEWEIRAPLIAERLQMDVRRVRRGVAAIVAAGLMRRTRIGWIEFNPELFWRGSGKSRVERRAVEEESA